MKSIYLIFIIFIPFCLFAHEKKVLFIDSYHEEYFWSEGLIKGIKNIKKKSDLNINLKTFYMDSKNKSSELSIKEAALKAKKLIESFKPDVVISCDDNAAKYLIMPYYNNSSLPFVFCGINGSADAYNFSRENITGMLEVELIKEMLYIIKDYSKGNTLAFLGTDSISERKELEGLEEVLGKKIQKRFVLSVEDWKKEYLSFQEKADILLLSPFSPLASKQEVREELSSFVKENTLIPSVSGTTQASNFTLLTFSKRPMEHGEWAMKTAIRILKGEKVKNIPYSKNKKAKMYINRTLMKKLKIHFPFELLENAHIIK